MTRTKDVYLFLGQIRGLHRKEQKLQLRINELEFGLLPSGIRYDLDKVQTSPRDRMSETFADMDELLAELLDIQLLIIDAKSEIYNSVYWLPNKERYVIIRYFVDMWDIRAIADDMGITERHVLRLKKNGVSMLAEGRQNARNRDDC